MFTFERLDYAKFSYLFMDSRDSQNFKCGLFSFNIFFYLYKEIYYLKMIQKKN